MARQEERAAATRQRLIAEATVLFATRGFAATSLVDLLDRVEVSRGAMYHHFASKEALFEAVLEAVEADLARRLAERVSDATDSTDLLRRGCHAFLAEAIDPVICQIVLTDAPGVLGWQRWREIDARHGFGLLSTTLAAALGPEADPDRVKVTAHVLLAALIELAMLVAGADDQHGELERALPVLDRLVDGLISPGP